MLSQEENELLCRTGAGTPMGELMRRYWIPAMLSEELPEPDGTPVRVRLLGEDLVAFRDSAGRVGIVDELCAHRCASLAYGRNEAGGLRCIYHGWKYAVDGRILETPPEPAESTFKDRLTLKAYPTREAAGVIWTYMGPPELMPIFPEWEWMQAPADQRSASKVIQECNWAQALEGDIDSSHSDYLHSSDIRGRPTDHAPTLVAEDTAYGFRYAAIRRPDHAGDQQRYVRITLFATPFHTFTPPNKFDSSRQGGGPYESAVMRSYVPIDDEHHAFFSFTVSRLGPILARGEREAGPETNWHPAGNRANMHLQDRTAMQAGNWTGIQGIRAQDRAVTESMGPVAPRYREHLGASDVAIIRMRRRMIDAAKALLAGAEPPGLDPAIRHDQIHSDDRMVPANVPWQAVLDAPDLIRT
ncbi:MAG: phthalate 4,5-dioxygenase [Chloroflexota bacterium]|jgi:phthalate 4,5-dioxygenase oxygenase subunit|nr:phthalate 4,5-dioxygenase [Chloroflexota bacterium]